MRQSGLCRLPDGVDDADFALVVSGVNASGACYLSGPVCIVTEKADCPAQSGTYAVDNVVRTEQ